MAGGRSRPLPSQELLHRLLEYDPDTGVFTWKPRGNSRFDNQFAGQRAFTAMDEGYYGGSILYSGRLQAHRIAWKYVYGVDPVGQIDHINGDRADNRIANLRDATPTEQRKNAAMPRTNTSGVIGVSYRTDKGKWRAFIGAASQRIHLGYFKTRDEAVAARRAAEIRLGFHENHGRPLCQ